MDVNDNLSGVDDYFTVNHIMDPSMKVTGEFHSTDESNRTMQDSTAPSSMASNLTVTGDSNSTARVSNYMGEGSSTLRTSTSRRYPITASSAS